MTNAEINLSNYAGRIKKTLSQVQGRQDAHRRGVIKCSPLRGRTPDCTQRQSSAPTRSIAVKPCRCLCESPVRPEVPSLLRTASRYTFAAVTLPPRPDRKCRTTCRSPDPSCSSAHCSCTGSRTARTAQKGDGDEGSVTQEHGMRKCAYSSCAENNLPHNLMAEVSAVAFWHG